MASALATRSFALCDVSPAEARLLRDALGVIRTALRPLSEHADAPSVMDGPHVVMQAQRWRCQLRCTKTSDESTSELQAACRSATRVLLPIAAKFVLPHGEQAAQSALPVPVLDAFYYPGANQEPSSPCPPHTDPGLVTIICDDIAALQVHSDGHWCPALSTLQENKVVVLAGRQLAGSKAACLHRVAPVSVCRTSIAFEWRLPAHEAHEATAREFATQVTPRGLAHKCYGAEAEARYARAGDVLRTLASGDWPRETAEHALLPAASCSLM